MRATAKQPSVIDITSIREDFPVLKTSMHGKPLVFLDNAASTQKPTCVIDAIRTYYESQHANVHRGVYALSARATDMFENVREKVRHFIGAGSTSEIIFTRGVTESINLVASSFGKAFLKPGDEILITGMEHHSNIVPWQIACGHYGASLKVVPVNGDGTFSPEDLENRLTPKTKLVAVVHISNTLGTINPVKEVIQRAHARDIPVLIDGAQAAPHLSIDVRALDADFYTFSGHKMYGPTGIGVLYGKEEWLDKLPPYQGGGEMIRTVSFEKTIYNTLPFKFEAGTPNIAGVIGLGATVEYLESLPRNRLELHEKRVLARATDLLSSISGLQIIGRAPEKASVLSFVIDGVHPYDLGTLLDQYGIAVRTGHHCTEPLMDHFGIPGTVRASFGIYNTVEEAEFLFESVGKAVKMLR